MNTKSSFYGLALLAFFGACHHSVTENKTAGKQPDDPVVHEIATVAGVPTLPQSMDRFAEAEQQLADGHFRMAAFKIDAGIAALKRELGTGKIPGAAHAIHTLQLLRARLASDNPVDPDTLHTAVVAALEFSPVEIRDTVLQRTLEVDNPQGVLPKLYKSESK
ncbi:MAG: hypothetical protein H6569_11905 [Lewinellaceae bacterium]|nr:hypothetical protein [Lewinellaceae bacterium]